MDVLLLTAVDPFSYQIIPDLGLLYLASALKRHGLSVSLRDSRFERLDYCDIERIAAKLGPMIVGIKCHSNELSSMVRMASGIRRTLPDAVIVAGGPHPSMDPEGALERASDLDYAFIGEGELTFPPFVQWVKQGGKGAPPDSIGGIAYRQGGEVIRREIRLEPELDNLDFPAWELAPPSKYPDEAAGIFVPAFPAAPMMLSRGCPFMCKYCGCRYISGARIRYRSVESVVSEMEMLERDYGVRSVTFVDDNFTFDRKRSMELFEALASRTKKSLSLSRTG